MTAPAKTGREIRRRTLITPIHQHKTLRVSTCSPPVRLCIVVIKFIAPIRDLAPAIWREKIAISTLNPLCPSPERGGYTVHPVPLPPSVLSEETITESAGVTTQNLSAFIRGNAISFLKHMKGISQFPNPAPRTGITTNKTMINACAVTMA